MPSGADINELAGKRIELFQPERGITDPETVAYNISTPSGPTGSWRRLWRAFMTDPRVSEISALAIGGEEDEVLTGTDCLSDLECLIGGRDRLPALKHLFLGANDLHYNDQRQLFALPDLSPLLLAFPRIETLRLYGWTSRGFSLASEEFRLGLLSNNLLRSLSIATVGLPAQILTDLWHSSLPSLEYLELWLDQVTETPSGLLTLLAPLFSGTLFPRLRYLALCNSPFADDLTQALVASPLIRQLKILDLSLSQFTKRGIQALLNGSLHLEKLIALDCEISCEDGMRQSSEEIIQHLRSLPIKTDIHALPTGQSLNWFHL